MNSSLNDGVSSLPSDTLELPKPTNAIAELSAKLRNQFSSVVEHTKYIDTCMCFNEPDLCPDYEAALKELKRIIAEGDVPQEQLLPYVTQIVHSIFLPDSDSSSQSNRSYDDVYFDLHESKVTPYSPIDSLEYVKLAPGTLLDVTRENYASSEFIVWDGKTGIQVPYTQVYSLRSLPVQQRLEAAHKCAMATIDVGHTTEWTQVRTIQSVADVFMEKHDGHITRDGRSLYKYYLVKDLGLPSEQQDQLFYTVFSEFLDIYRKNWQQSQQYFSTPKQRDSVQYTLSEMRYLAHHAPIQNKQLLHNLQQEFTAFASDLLRYDEMYALQELSRALQLPMSNYAVYAEEAIDAMLNEAGADESQFIDVLNILRLQEQYNVPVTPERTVKAAQAAYSCIGSADDTPIRFARTFKIPFEQMQRCALKESKRSLAESLQEDEESHYEAHVGNHAYISGMLQRFAIDARELPDLVPKITALEEALNSGEDQINECLEELATTKLRRYLPELVLSILQVAMQSADHAEWYKLHRMCTKNKRLQEPYNSALEQVFSQKPYTPGKLHLSSSYEQNLWQNLYEKYPNCQANLVKEWNHYISSVGLNAQHTAATLQNCSHTPAKRERYNAHQETIGTSYRLHKRNDTHNVAARIMQTVALLEQQCPGAATYFQQNRGISMFNRYPVDFLTQVYTEETSTPEQQHSNVPIKGHMIVLLPHSDWNGAFENHKAITNVQKNAARQKLQVHIAESGKRVGCLRQLAKLSKQYGALKAAVIGGHADETGIEFGPNPEDTLTLEELQNIDAKHLNLKLEKKLDRLRAFFAPDAIIVFKSCSVGKQDGITHKIAGLLNRITVGAETPTSLQNIRLDLAQAQYSDHAKSNTYFPNTLSKLKYTIKRWWNN